MAISLYSRVKVKPLSVSSIEIGFDLPLKLLSGFKSKPSPGQTAELIRPLRIAAEATLDRVRKRGLGVSFNVECEIPIGAGLGSSASTTVAIAAAISKSLGVDLSEKELFDVAFIPERYLHGTPSGVDQATCIHGGMIQFTRPSIVKPISVDEGPILLLCDTRVHHATKTLVGSVVQKSRKEETIFRDHLSQARDISTGVIKSLKRGDDDELGELMSQNHELLRKIGVSHVKLDKLVRVANQAGALGAKMTGAGGGGCIVALCRNEASRKNIARRLAREGGMPFSISRDDDGVVASTVRGVLK